MQTNPRQRLPRYYRTDTPPRIRNLQNYLPLLEMVQEFRFMDSAQIAALSPVSQVNTFAKLKKLYHNGMVERYALPSTEFTQGSAKFIYTLDRKGAEALTDADPERFREVYYPKKRRSVYLVAHALMITNLRTCLTLAFWKKNQPDTGLTAWAQGKALETIWEPYQIRGHRVIPDAYFIITTPKKEIHCFLEADRGTMKLSRFADKVKRYRKFFNANRHRLPAHFRVITLAPTPRRADNLRIITMKSDKDKTGSERFWFTDETKFRITDPTKTLAPIFRPGLREAEMKLLSLLF